MGNPKSFYYEFPDETAEGSAGEPGWAMSGTPAGADDDNGRGRAGPRHYRARAAIP